MAVSFHRDPYMQLLGLEIKHLEPGRALLQAQVQPQHLNIHGSCHGGFLYSLADAAFALASNSHGTPAVALSTSMQYFKAVSAGENLEAEAREENLGRRTATYRIEVRSNERVVALFTGTVFRVEES
jgi:acyl-CoA thioesterase